MQKKRTFAEMMSASRNRVADEDLRAPAPSPEAENAARILGISPDAVTSADIERAKRMKNGPDIDLTIKPEFEGARLKQKFSAAIDEKPSLTVHLRPDMSQADFEAVVRSVHEGGERKDDRAEAILEAAGKIKNVGERLAFVAAAAEQERMIGDFVRGERLAALVAADLARAEAVGVPDEAVAQAQAILAGQVPEEVVGEIVASHVGQSEDRGPRQTP